MTVQTRWRLEDLVTAPVEFGRDRLTDRSAAVGEVGVAVCPPVHGPSLSSGLGPAPDESPPIHLAPSPFPHFGFEIGAVAVPFDDGETVITVAGCRQERAMAGARRRW